MPEFLKPDLPISRPTAGAYTTVAASQSDAPTAFDYLHRLTIVPATTSPGAVSIKDGSGSSITVFEGGASSVVDLAPINVELSCRAGEAWFITTGADVSVIASGSVA